MNRGVVAAMLLAVTCLQLAPALAEEPPPPEAAPAPATEAAPPAAAPTALPEASAPRTPMVERNEKLVVDYRWPRWIPWTVFGGGLALTGGGLLLAQVASGEMSDYDQGIASQCAVNGCNLTNPQTPGERALVDQYDRARRDDKISKVVLLVGAATFVTGVVLLVMNKATARKVTVDVVPAPGGASTSVGWRF